MCIKKGSRYVQVLLLALALSQSVAAQAPSLSIGGVTTGTLEVPIGGSTAVIATGPTNGDLAIFCGFESMAYPIDFGTLRVDPFEPGAFYLVNSFEGGTGLSTANPGTFVGLYQPFLSGPAGQHLYVQGLIEDPAHPFGYQLTDLIDVESAQPMPELHTINPNYAAPGGRIVIRGKNFEVSPGATTVSLRGMDCPVVYCVPNELHAILPADARSGPITITTAGGSVGGRRHMIPDWLTVASTPYDEATAQANPSSQSMNTAVGRIQTATEVDLYNLIVPAGSEIFVEAYSYDVLDGRITGTNNTTNRWFNPFISVTRASQTLATDLESGPEYAAAIGLEDGESFLVADQTAVYTIAISGFASRFGGDYFVVYGFRPPSSAPLGVHGVSPAISSRGGRLSVYGSGIFASLGTSAYTASVAGVAAPVIAVYDGRLDITVPLTAPYSGQVQIATATDATNYPLNRLQSWVTLVQGVVLDEPSAVLAGTMPSNFTVFGALTAGIEQDRYPMRVQQGRRYRVEATAYDPQTFTLLSGAFANSSPLDPELSLLPEAPSAPVLATDGASGPGSNALIGQEVTPVFTAPYTGNVIVVVRSLLSFSTGDYVLTVVELP